MNDGVENKTPVEPLNKFPLNVYPGGGYKGNWSQPMGKKFFLGENACSSWPLQSKKSQWLQGDTRHGV